MLTFMDSSFSQKQIYFTVVYSNIKKAFDSVSHKQLLKILS